MAPEQSDIDSFLGPKITSEPSPRPTSDLHAVGKYVTLDGLAEEDIPKLWRNLDSSVFNYLPMLRQSSPEDFSKAIQHYRDRGFVIYAIKANPGCLTSSSRAKVSGATSHTEVLGAVAFLDIQPEHRALEVGAVMYSQRLQRTAAATEAQYLLLRYAFGEEPSSPLWPPYRRVVWKCNQRNAASRRAAERLGFVYEGTFRKHMILSERSRDSEFFSIIDDDWSGFVKAGLERWLQPDNFDAEGRQVRNLEQYRESCKRDYESTLV